MKTKEITLSLSPAQFRRIAKIAGLLKVEPESLVRAVFFRSLDSTLFASTFLDNWPTSKAVYGVKMVAHSRSFSKTFENDLAQVMAFRALSPEDIRAFNQKMINFTRGRSSSTEEGKR